MGGEETDEYCSRGRTWCVRPRLSLRAGSAHGATRPSRGPSDFHVSGPPACVVIDGKPLPLTPANATAISPWQPHFFSPIDRREPTLALVLYIRPGWFADASHTAFEILRFGRPAVEMSDHITRLASETARLLADHGGGDGSFEDRLSALTQAAFDQTWQWTSAADRPAAQCSGLARFPPEARDKPAEREARRTRRPCRDFAERRPFAPAFLQAVSRADGAASDDLPQRPAHGTRDRAIGQGLETVSEIGLDLGFATPASFSRFFIANGVVPPSAYRRSVAGLAH